MSALRLGAAPTLVLALAIEGCGHDEPPPLQGTWDVAPSLRRKLDRRLLKHRERTRVLTLRFERARARHRDLVAQLHSAVVSRQTKLEAPVPGCKDQGALGDLIVMVLTLGLVRPGQGCRPNNDEALLRAADVDAALALHIRPRARKAGVRFRRARSELRPEQRLARRVRAKVRAVRLIEAERVSCRLRDSRVRIEVVLRNRSAARVRAIVHAAYVVRGGDGRRATAVARPDAVFTLRAGERRARAIDAGAPPSDGRAPTTLVACRGQLADVRLAAFAPRRRSRPLDAHR